MSADHERQPADDARRTRAFISYSRMDRDFVARLVAALEDRRFEPYLDTRDIAPGEAWQERLAALVASADAVIVTLSGDYLASAVCQWELGEAARLGKRLVPILCRPVPHETLPPPIRRLNYLRFDGDGRFDAGIAALAAALTADIAWTREGTRLGESALRWDERGRADLLLPRGRDLHDAEAWLAAAPASQAPSELQRAFIAAGRQKAARRDQAVAAAIRSSNAMVVELAHKFQNQEGVPSAMILGGLQNAEALIAGVAADDDTDVDLLRTLGFVLSELSASLITQNRLADGLAAADRASEIFDALATRFPDAEARRSDRFVGLDRLGDALLISGREEEAHQAYATNLARAREQVLTAPGDPAWQDHLAVALEKHADMTVRAGDPAAALAAYREAEGLRRAMADAYPEGVAYRRDLAVVTERIADTLLALDDRAAAMSVYDASFTITRDIAEADPRRTDWQRELAVASQRMGDALLAGGEDKAALRFYENDLAIMHRLADSDPTNARWKLDALKSLDRVGRLCGQIGDPERALSVFRQGLALANDLAATTPDSSDWRAVAAFCQRICSSLVELGEVAGAAAEAERAVALLEGEPPASPGRTERFARALNNAAWYSLLALRHAEAAAFSERAYGLAPDDVDVVLNRIHALCLNGAVEDARRLRAIACEAHLQLSKLAARDLTALAERGVDTTVIRDVFSSGHSEA